MNNPIKAIAKLILADLLEHPQFEVRAISLLATLLHIEKGALHPGDFLGDVLLEILERGIRIPDDMLPDLENYRLRTAERLLKLHRETT